MLILDPSHPSLPRVPIYPLHLNVNGEPPPSTLLNCFIITICEIYYLKYYLKSLFQVLTWSAVNLLHSFTCWRNVQRRFSRSFPTGITYDNPYPLIFMSLSFNVVCRELPRKKKLAFSQTLPHVLIYGHVFYIFIAYFYMRFVDQIYLEVTPSSTTR